ncbi:class I SAM-dependent methyltransferase [Candidatus Uabimicrobium sp. HlEnr_7]|uniref:class I SAM-dependent methyltransferase n=1 Tax=Candidatus Uabimicrobium helgolandensis TaxID=3095367 RepID=UPI003556ECA2
MRLTDHCHLYVKKILCLGGVAVDATVGNGYDTCFLANIVGESGRVFGFDIQPAAITCTKERLKQQGLTKNTVLFNKSHSLMKEFISKDYHHKLQVIMFNLGYLPGADKKIITKSCTTITAFNEGLKLLAKGGHLIVMVYTGHDGGDKEWQDIQEWFSTLNTSLYNINFPVSPSPRREVPKLFAIEKI